MSENNVVAIELSTYNCVAKAIVVEDGVFIGANVTILKGTYIGKNSIIGAGSVVTGKIPANEIWGGNPAKYIKQVPKV